MLRRTGLAPERLELELTERTVLTDVESSIQRLNELRALGITIAIDDFGTGYSSLSYMVKLPIDTLKIDASFIGLTEESNQARAIVSSIIAMGHAIDVNLVAEGIETEKQLQFVREAGCRYAQGFGLARPSPFEPLSGVGGIEPEM